MPHDSPATSSGLLRGVVIHDNAAWKRLVSLYSPLVLSCCRRSGLQDNDAADVFQDVFQAVAANIKNFRKRRATDSLSGWLRTITVNKIHDHFRRCGRQPAAVGGSTAQRRFSEIADGQDEATASVAPSAAQFKLVDVGTDGEDAGIVLHRALELVRSEFEPRTWQAFWRTAVLQEPTAHVAEYLHMTPGAIRVAKSRVLHRLREDFGELIE